MSVDKPQRIPSERRPKYRAGNRETAVKVFTINQESKYLIVRNVPALGNTQELLKMFALYGTIDEYRHLDEDLETPEFTDAYWIRFKDLAQARYAKKKCDDYNFFGHLLDVNYATEFESLHDMREKLEERRRVVANKIYQAMLEEKKLEGTRQKRGREPTPATAALDVDDIPYEHPGFETTVSEFEMMPAPQARRRQEQFAGKNQRGHGSAPTQSSADKGGAPPPWAQQDSTSTTAEPVDEDYGNTSMTSTVLSIRNKLRKLSDTNTTSSVPQARSAGGRKRI